LFDRRRKKKKKKRKFVCPRKRRTKVGTWCLPHIYLSNNTNLEVYKCRGNVVGEVQGLEIMVFEKVQMLGSNKNTINRIAVEKTHEQEEGVQRSLREGKDP